MYDYMKALQKRFDRQEYPELAGQIEYAHEDLRRDMDAAGRRKLLRLLDVQNALLTESKLMSFTAGFKLAWGMAKETGVGRVATQQATTPKQESGSSKMCWERRRRNARQN